MKQPRPVPRQRCSRDGRILQSQEVDHRRRHVSQRDRLGNPAAGGHPAREADQQRDVQRRPVETVSVSEEAVVAELFPMIGSDRDHRIPQQALLRQLVEQPAELIVEVGDGALVGSDLGLQTPRASSRLSACGNPGAPVADQPGGEAARAELGIEGSRRQVRLMGVEVIQEREEGPSLLAGRRRNRRLMSSAVLRPGMS